MLIWVCSLQCTSWLWCTFCVFLLRGGVILHDLWKQAQLLPLNILGFFSGNDLLDKPCVIPSPLLRLSMYSQILHDMPLLYKSLFNTRAWETTGQGMRRERQRETDSSPKHTGLLQNYLLSISATEKAPRITTSIVSAGSPCAENPYWHVIMTDMLTELLTFYALVDCLIWYIFRVC